MKMQFKLINFLFALLIGSTMIGAQEPKSTGQVFRIDAKQSQFAVEVGTSGVFGFMGHAHHIAVQNFSGQVNATPENGSVEVRVVSDSLIETAKFSEKDMNTINTTMKQDVLETSKYPEILFKSSSVSVKSSSGGKYQVQVKGDLTLHGMTRAVSFPATVTLEGDKLRANGNFKIQREDYKVKADSAGGGTVKVGKEVKINFNIVALRSQ